MREKKLVFQNGTVLFGTGFGADVQRVCEVVFNTSMVGYQEIFSDLSYYGQFVCMTYPLIGNYGMADADYESVDPRIGGLIVREYNESLANFRAAKTLAETMEEQGIPGIEGVDTRRITRMIRSEGSMLALLCNAALPEAEALALLQNATPAQGCVPAVSCEKRWYARTANARWNVVAVDCGIKRGIVDSLLERRCNVTVVPYNTPAAEILSLAPDGVLFSNGPGDPQDVPVVAETITALWGQKPLMGICLGHQLIARAAGCETYKLKFGHRGGNHPVRAVDTGRIAMTSQNHSFAVDAASVTRPGLCITHVNLLDNTVEGLADDAAGVFSVQYHPESRPGPQDSGDLFDTFLVNMDRFAGEGR